LIQTILPPLDIVLEAALYLNVGETRRDLKRVVSFHGGLIGAPCKQEFVEGKDFGLSWNG
jgi:hypothetical protein